MHPGRIQLGIFYSNTILFSKIFSYSQLATDHMTHPLYSATVIAGLSSFGVFTSYVHEVEKNNDIPFIGNNKSSHAHLVRY